MLYRIIGFSVKHKLIIALLVFGLIGAGVYQTTKLPIDAVPDITNNQVQVITVAPSFGATDIERLVTFPVEQANSNIHGLHEIRSFSRFGLSVVTIVFDDNIDVYWARQQVAERLQQIQSEIPEGIGKPELGPITTGLGEIYQYIVRAEKGYEQQYDITELRTLQDWVIRRQLLSVKGVAEVSSFGGNLKQYEVAVSPDKLNAYGISITDVFDALKNNNENTGGAYIEKGPAVLYIRSEGLISSVNDIKNIAIDAAKSDVPLFIGDVADVRIGHATRYGALTYNDEGEVAGAIVMMLKGANSSQVIRDVKARVAQIQKTLPDGVVIEPFLDRTKMVNSAIHTVEKNLMEGALIVVFILVLFLGNIRAGLLVASVIPLSMLFAVCMMNLFGVSGNLMSLGALDFGLIIDGAVIIVESVMHQLSRHKRYRHLTRIDSDEMDTVVTTSAGRMMNAAVFGQLIILIVYLPILTLQGIEGKMFKPMAQTVAFALLGAFLLSLTYIPMMSALVLKKRRLTPSFSDRMMNKVERHYLKYLLKAIRIPKMIFAISITLFIIAIVILSRMGGEFIPSLEEGDFAVEFRVLPGSSLNTTIENVQKASHILLTRFPEVQEVVAKIGSGEVPTDPMPMDAADMMIILKDKKEWTSAKSFPELSEKMAKALDDVPGITAGFQYPVQMRFNELMTGARQDVVIKIFGDNLDSLFSTAGRLGQIATSVRGVRDLYIEPISGLPQVVVKYNRAVIARYHLNISDINNIIHTAFAGQSAGLVFEGEKRFDLVVRLNPDELKNLNNIRNLLVPTPSGSQIPLSLLADVDLVSGPNQIQRENAQRRIVVGFNIKDRDVQSIVNELREKADTQLRLPVGYHMTYGGSFENLIHATRRLAIVVPIAFVLIFFLLYLAFNSIRESLLIYTAIPLSVIGGVFLLALRGMPFSISAGIGFIALSGVAVLNGIVLISEFNRLRKSGIKNVVRIVIDGGEARLRPVLMTAFVASLGFIPMALSQTAGAEVQRPLATVVIGGLLMATLLTLFVLPLLFITFEKGFKMKRRKKIITVLWIGLLFSVVSGNTSAQTRITLDEAIKIALDQNKNLRIEKLKSAYAKALIKTGADIPQTAVTAAYGQINSAYSDVGFSASQSIAFPGVYKRQKRLFSKEWEESLLNVSLQEYELKEAVSLVFYNIIYWREKQKLLQDAFSLYSTFAEKAALRLSAGETTILETITADNQKSVAEIQIKQTEQELSNLQIQLRWLLNTKENYVPETGKGPEPQMEGIDEHPLLGILEQKKKISEEQILVEKSKLLPGLLLGYNLNSFKGMGPDDKRYDASPRFSSVQAGFTIPIFSKGQRARVTASRIAGKMADSAVQNARSALQKRYEQLLTRYQSNREIVNRYEKTELKNAGVMIKTAQEQFAAGEINFLEFAILINQAITIKNNYADAVWELNKSIIELRYIHLSK